MFVCEEIGKYIDVSGLDRVEDVSGMVGEKEKVRPLSFFLFTQSVEPTLAFRFVLQEVFIQIVFDCCVLNDCTGVFILFSRNSHFKVSRIVLKEDVFDLVRAILRRRAVFFLSKGFRRFLA